MANIYYFIFVWFFRKNDVFPLLFSIERVKLVEKRKINQQTEPETAILTSNIGDTITRILTL